jgi:hypothetical protein
MKKILLAYDELTGDVTDQNGYHLGRFLGTLLPFNHDKNTSDNSDAIIKLKASGFEVEDIIALKSSGLI